VVGKTLSAAPVGRWQQQLEQLELPRHSEHFSATSTLLLLIAFMYSPEPVFAIINQEEWNKTNDMWMLFSIIFSCISQLLI
jgi:hypothetical protein